MADAIRRQAIQDIQHRGGEIEWDRSAPGQRVAKITLLEEPLADGDLVLLEPISELRELSVRGLRISDAGLAPLASLAGLEALRINYTQITDAGLAGLEKLGQLRRLDLTGCFRVTDVGLGHLKRLPKLQTLNLTSTRVSDQGVAALQKARPDLEVRRRFADPPGGSAKRPTGKDIPFLSSFLRSLRSKALQQTADVFKRDQDWTGLAVALDDVLQSHPNEIWLWRMYAWNCAYNLGAEPDDPLDRYWWIKQAIKALVCASQLNPDSAALVWDVGWFTGQKIGRSDEARLYRRLFARDAELHRVLIAESAGDEVLGPTGDPDLWLVARRWFQEACDRPAGSDAQISPLVLFSEPPLCLILYAEAIEQEGVFGQTATEAWEQAANQWNAFGDHDLPTTMGASVRLNDLPKHAEEAEKLRAKLDALAPGLREKIVNERIEAVPPSMLRAWKKDPAERTPAEREVAARVERLVHVGNQEVAERVDPAHRPGALQLAQEADEAERTAFIIKQYRLIVNYDYWALRCRIEQLPSTLGARQRLHEARERLNRRPVTPADIAAAKEHFEQGFALWKQTLEAHPALYEQESMAKDLLGEVAFYRDRILHGEPLSHDFPLKKLVERWARP